MNDYLDLIVTFLWTTLDLIVTFLWMNYLDLIVTFVIFLWTRCHSQLWTTQYALIGIWSGDLWISSPTLYHCATGDVGT